MWNHVFEHKLHYNSWLILQPGNLVCDSQWNFTLAERLVCMPCSEGVWCWKPSQSLWALSNLYHPFHSQDESLKVTHLSSWEFHPKTYTSNITSINLHSLRYNDGSNLDIWREFLGIIHIATLIKWSYDDNETCGLNGKSCPIFFRVLFFFLIFYYPCLHLFMTFSLAHLLF